MAWLTGEERRLIRLNECVESVVDLIRTDSEMRGVKILNQVESNAMVMQRSVRSVLTAILIAIVDSSDRPPRIVVKSLESEKGIEVVMESIFDDARLDNVFIPGEEVRFTWEEAKCIAKHESVPIACNAPPNIAMCSFEMHVADSA